MTPIKIISSLLLLVLSGCVDTFSPTYWKYGLYTVEESTDGGKRLYLNFEEGAIGRIDSITKIGVKNDYIFAESHDGASKSDKSYWMLPIRFDHKYYNAVEIVEGPYTLTEFQYHLNQLEIKPPVFQQDLE